MNKKIIAAAVLTIFLAVSMPLMAEDDFVDLNDYNLDLTVEQRTILEEELKTIVDISGEIDLGMIKIILGELEKEDEDFEEDYDEDNDEANFGRGLAQRIREYKANNEDWTGQGLSNMIHNYMEDNGPASAASDNAKMNQNNNPSKGNNPGKENDKSNNNPGKGN